MKTVARLLSYAATKILTPRVLERRDVGYGLMYDPDPSITFPNGALGPVSFLFGTNANTRTNTSSTHNSDEGKEGSEEGEEYYVKILPEGSILESATQMIHDLWQQHEMMNDSDADSDSEDSDSDSDKGSNESACKSSSSISRSIHTNAMALLRLRGADATEIISRNLLFHRSHNAGNGHGHDFKYKYKERLHDDLPHGTVIKVTFFDEID